MEKRKILIIDDERDTVFVTKVALSANGYTVIFADNGREGMRLAEEKMPDVIVLDIVMPDIDGIKVENQLKSNPVTSDIPIIFSTCLTSCSVNDRNEDIIFKPYDIEDLIDKIENLLGKAEIA